MVKDDDTKHSDTKSRNEALRGLAKISQIGLTMVSCVVVGVFLGYMLDRWLGTEPWLLLVLLLLGIAAGFKSVYRLIKEIDGQ